MSNCFYLATRMPPGPPVVLSFCLCYICYCVRSETSATYRNILLHTCVRHEVYECFFFGLSIFRPQWFYCNAFIVFVLFLLLLLLSSVLTSPSSSSALLSKWFLGFSRRVSPLSRRISYNEKCSPCPRFCFVLDFCSAWFLCERFFFACSICCSAGDGPIISIYVVCRE